MNFHKGLCCLWSNAFLTHREFLKWSPPVPSLITLEIKAIKWKEFQHWAERVLGVGPEQQDGLGVLCPFFQPPAVPHINSCAAEKSTSTLLWGLSHPLQVRSGQGIKPKTEQTLQTHRCSGLPWSLLRCCEHILTQARGVALTSAVSYDNQYIGFCVLQASRASARLPNRTLSRVAYF